MPPQPQSRNKLRANLRTCKRKVKHPTLEYAEKALRETSAKYPDTLLQIYPCLACGFFHLGNELSRADARHGLTKLEKIMGHPNFWTKAPKNVIEHFQVVRQKCRKRLGLTETPLDPVECNNELQVS